MGIWRVWRSSEVLGDLEYLEAANIFVSSGVLEDKEELEIF